MRHTPKLELTLHALALAPLLQNTQHVHGEGLVHIGQRRERHVLLGVLHRVELARAHFNHLRLDTAGGTIDAPRRGAQCILVHRLVQRGLDEVVGGLKEL